MPAPAVVGAIIWGYRAWRAYQAYETAMTVKETAETVAEIARRRREVQNTLRSTIQSLSSEIDVKSSTFANVDPGGNSTISRRGSEGRDYREYIERKIPFRPAISAVCRLALAMPIKVPRRVRSKIPGEAVENTIEVALKQTTASLMFEGIDELLEWKSPLKAEPAYTRAGVPYLGTPNTRPKRIGKVFPFWPRPRGSLAPDLVIVEYRQQPFDVSNVHAAVEVKFPGDWVKSDQMNDYSELMRTKSKVALLRVPEDCTGVRNDSTGQRTQTNRPSGTKRR
ncbi:VRR-NUC domain-containing protein [Cupriavidus gilardii]|nr:VRR-NUC domain-containing protein [Cupriavidus gilardii]